MTPDFNSYTDTTTSNSQKNTPEFHFFATLFMFYLIMIVDDKKSNTYLVADSTENTYKTIVNNYPALVIYNCILICFPLVLNILFNKVADAEEEEMNPTIETIFAHAANLI